jgi:hypothetical protein
MTQITIDVDPETHKKIRKVAAESNVSLAKAAVMLLKQTDATMAVTRTLTEFEHGQAGSKVSL